MEAVARDFLASNFLGIGLFSRQMLEYGHHKYEARVMISP
jgi:hypothetical protein